MYDIITASRYNYDELNASLDILALNTALDEAIAEYCSNKSHVKCVPFVLAVAYEDGMPMASQTNERCDTSEAVYDLRVYCADINFDPDEIIVFLCNGREAHVISIE